MTAEERAKGFLDTFYKLVEKKEGRDISIRDLAIKFERLGLKFPSTRRMGIYFKSWDEGQVKHFTAKNGHTYIKDHQFKKEEPVVPPKIDLELIYKTLERIESNIDRILNEPKFVEEESRRDPEEGEG